MVQTNVKVAAGIGGAGLVILVIGCILIPVFDKVRYEMVVKSVRLVPGTDAYENYLVPASPIIIEFWFFNLTNADAVINNASTPIVDQIGPYTYFVDKPKEAVESLEGERELRYQIRSTYQFLPDASPGLDPFTDIVVNVNFVVLTLAKLMEHGPDSLQAMLSKAIADNNDTIFEPYIVDDYLWGYEDPTAEQLPIPSTFGLYYGSNDTLADELVVNTGLDDVDLVNEVIMWRGNDTITTSEMTGEKPMWSTDKCNRIDGTDGTQYRPFINREDKLYTFSAQVCRSFDTTFDSDVTVRGIDLLRFVLDPQSFAHHTVNPDNEGYCTPDLDHCLSPGFLNLSNCFGGVPLVGSLAHYYMGEHMLDTIIGLSPNKEEHQTTIDIEPTTGFTLQGHKRLQINIYIEPWTLFPDTNATIFQNGFIFPIFWINESSVITQEDADAYISDVIIPLEAMEIVQYVVIGLGALLLICGLVGYVYIHISQPKHKGPDAVEYNYAVKGGSFKKDDSSVYENDVFHVYKN